MLEVLSVCSWWSLWQLWPLWQVPHLHCASCTDEWPAISASLWQMARTVKAWQAGGKSPARGMYIVIVSVHFIPSIAKVSTRANFINDITLSNMRNSWTSYSVMELCELQAFKFTTFSLWFLFLPFPYFSYCLMKLLFLVQVLEIVKEADVKVAEVITN